MHNKGGFRALIQNVGLSKVKNTPKRRIQHAAEEARRSSEKGSRSSNTTAAGAAPTSASAASSTDASDHPTGGREALRLTPASLLSLRWRAPFGAAARGGSSSASSVLERLEQLRLHMQTTANMRAKLRRAFLATTAAYEQFLATAAKAMEPPSASLTSSTTGTTTTAAASPSQTESGASKATATATAAAGAAAFYLDRMHFTFEEAKRYYSSTPFDQRWDDILSCLAVLGRTSRGNAVVPYHDSAQAFESMWRAVDAAKRRVHWQTYICKDDFVGQATVRRLMHAHQRGCDTELLYDCGGNISGRSRLTEDLKQAGAKVIPYRPFFRSFVRYLFKGLDWRRSPGLRNHRKILLVDELQGFCGGLNIGNEYCGKAVGGTGKFRDTHCGVTGPAAAYLAEVYQDTKQPHPWKYGWRRWRQIASQQITRRVSQGRMRMERNELYRAFQEERQRTGQRLQDVPSASIKVMRGRWAKQTAQLRTLMQWSCDGAAAEDMLDREAGGKRGDETGTSASPPPPPQPSASKVEAKGDDQQKVSDETASVHRSAVPPARETAAAAAAARRDQVDTGAEHTATTATAATATAASAAESPKQGGKHNGTRSSAMRRRLLAARRAALYRATDLPHKRAYTDMLRRVPVLDTEPVPEAEMYMQQRAAVTQILSCNPRYRDYSIQYAFWQVTRKCHRRIWITTPYYLPTRKLFTALVQAARRGVDVRLLAGSNQTTDPWFMWHASNYITEQLLSAGVKIYEFKGQQIMHGKTVVVDSVWSSIGSYNWDLMSNRNLEVCLCHLDLEMAQSMEAQFLRDLAQSVEVRLADHRQRSRWLRFTSWMFYNAVFLLDRITFRSFANEDVVDVPGVPRD